MRDNSEEPIEISEEDSSDGEGALRDAKQISASITAGRRGPKSDTLTHFHDPVPIKEPSGPRWAFKCKHCSMYVRSQWKRKYCAYSPCLIQDP